MPTPKISRKLAEQTVDWVQECVNDGFNLVGYPSAIQEAAKRHNLNDTTFQNRYRKAWSMYRLKAEPVAFVEPSAPEPKPDADRIIREALLKGSKTGAELMFKTGLDFAGLLEIVESLSAGGLRILQDGDFFEIPKHQEPSFMLEPKVKLVSDKNNLFKIGVVSDNHCASKYERRDVLENLYDRFEDAGIKHVFHCGNWIDGEAPFNRHDLLAHGVDRQCQMLADTYPYRKGITTYAVAGDDHEGWYSQREGIDIGSYCESVMRRAGRNDWVDLGFMESNIPLTNVNTGTMSRMAVVHLGGGSSYALSYAVQKVIESLEGGEKPAVGLYGHLHKLWSGNIRNVWCLLAGCCQDQTPFMRKRKLEAHVAGTLVGMEQDPESGAIVGFAPDMKRFFTKGFYEGRWSHHGPVSQPERTIGGL